MESKERINLFLSSKIFNDHNELISFSECIVIVFSPTEKTIQRVFVIITQKTPVISPAKTAGIICVYPLFYKK